MCDECCLQRVQGRLISQRFDSLDLGAIKLSRQSMAGEYCMTVEQNGAGATRSLIDATFVPTKPSLSRTSSARVIFAGIVCSLVQPFTLRVSVRSKAECVVTLD
jgi:hypothetical protein